MAEPIEMLQGATLVATCWQEVTNLFFPSTGRLLVTVMQDTTITDKIQWKPEISNKTWLCIKREQNNQIQ